MIKVTINPETDIVLDRTVDAPRELIWKAWTQPEHLMPWFCPAPWKAVECEIDLRPGGQFRTLMLGPDGQRMPVVACYLEVVENERLSWTDTMGAGFRPKAASHVPFTAIITLEKKGNGTRYLVQALHSDAATKAVHDKMGFLEGWSAALDQLVVYAKSMPK